MISSTLGGVIVLAQAFLGMHGHDAPRPGCCDVCGVRRAAVLDGDHAAADVSQLAEARRRGARAPQGRLALPPRGGGCPGVLPPARLRGGGPGGGGGDAGQAGTLHPGGPPGADAGGGCDPDHATRKWARRALKAMSGRCEAPCQVCGPTPGGFAVSPQVGRPRGVSRTPAGTRRDPRAAIRQGCLPRAADGFDRRPSRGRPHAGSDPRRSRLLRPAVFTRRSRPNFAPFLLGPPPRSASGR